MTDPHATRNEISRLARVARAGANPISRHALEQLLYDPGMVTLSQYRRF